MLSVQSFTKDNTILYPGHLITTKKYQDKEFHHLHIDTTPFPYIQEIKNNFSYKNMKVCQHTKTSKVCQR